MAGMGFNIDGTFLDESDRVWLKEKLKLNPPNAITVLSNIHYAIELKNALPLTKVCYRQFWGGVYDNIHLNNSVDNFLYIYRDALANDLIVYSTNEPTLSPELSDWEYELSRKILERKKRAVQFNWSVGMPNEKDSSFDIWKKNLEIMANNRGSLYLGLHEYFFGHPFLEANLNGTIDSLQSYRIPVEQKNFIIGRYRWILDYCKRAIGKTPHIIFTEAGWDEVHDLHSKINLLPFYKPPFRLPNIIPALDLWSALSNLPRDEYVLQQFKIAWEKIYKLDSEIQGICFFPFGGVNDWDVMSIHRHKGMTERLIRGYDFSSMQEQEGSSDMIVNSRAERIVYTGVPLNLRKNPTTSSSLLLTIQKGDDGFVFPDNKRVAGGYTWIPALFKDDTGSWYLGYIAFSVLGVSWDVYTENTTGVNTEKIKSLAQEIITEADK